MRRRIELKDSLTDEEKEQVEQRRLGRTERVGSNELDRMQMENMELLRKLKQQHVLGSREAVNKVKSSRGAKVDVKSLTKEEKEKVLMERLESKTPKLSDLHII